ncbi:hypothetical protein XA68_10787 [Ophiocordyceps unilateralis]|uniref:Uncharacterized protein n=1 Tax=Ophiocordyceps unilateralis TaxID=268505 RepID=A0A2A9PH62_OPHUN|nr:hypothetical protein XA68_10787 [Ophiocordyceps unilateralis]
MKSNNLLTLASQFLNEVEKNKALVAKPYILCVGPAIDCRHQASSCADCQKAGVGRSRYGRKAKETKHGGTRPSFRLFPNDGESGMRCNQCVKRRDSFHYQ